MVANSVKKEVFKKWLAKFPHLQQYGSGKLLKILGLVTIGMDLVKLPRSDYYRPYFVCYPLWKQNRKACMEEPIFLQEIRNNKGLQFNIPFLKNDEFFKEAHECTNKQVMISFEDDVDLKSLFKVIDYQFSNTLVRSSPVAKAKLFKLKVYIALYLKDENKVQKLLDEILNISKYWPPELFEWKYGKVSEWVEELKRTVQGREEFLKQIDENRNDKVLGKLHESKIIN